MVLPIPQDPVINKFCLYASFLFFFYYRLHIESIVQYIYMIDYLC